MNDTVNHEKKFPWRIPLCVALAAGIITAGTIVLTSNHIKTPNNIILISIDTLRADRLSCYGYKYKTTPNIDALAQEAVLFENCFTNIPLTMPSHASMLTGLIPPVHGVHDNNRTSLDDSVVTLPERLKEEGYATYGIISAEVLNKRFGLNQGFDVYDDTFDDKTNKAQYVMQRTGDETAAHALKWLEENQDKKKFMFIHFYDPHDDYEPPAPYDKQFKHPYDGEIAFTDHCIGQVIDKLRSLGQYKNALIVIVGDHGEMLGEHGESLHGFYIYNNVLRVPMVIKPAGRAKAHRIGDNTTVIDITPTILSQAGIEVPSDMHGVNLSEYFTRSNHHILDRFIFSESLTPTKYNGNSLLGIINNQWHYIQTTQPELYNRINDPDELNNLINSEPKRADYLKKHLRQVIDDASTVGNASSIVSDYPQRAALKSLGYVGGAIDTDMSFDHDKPNPNALLGVHIAVQNGDRLAYEEKYDEAIKLCKQLIRQHPDIAPPYETLAYCYIALKSYDKAISLLKKQLERFPNNIDAFKYLAGSYFCVENYREAVKYYNRIVKRYPNDVVAYTKLAESYVKLKEYDKAAESLQCLLALSPDDLHGLRLLVKTYTLAEDDQRAIEALKTILKLTPEDIEAYRRLSHIYVKRKSYDKVVAVLEKMLLLRPENALIMNSLAWHKAAHEGTSAYAPKLALAYAERSVEMSSDKNSPVHGNYPYFLDTLSVAQAANGEFEAAIETAELALALCEQKGLTTLVSQIREHLTLYRQRYAYSE